MILVGKKKKSAFGQKKASRYSASHRAVVPFFSRVLFFSGIPFWPGPRIAHALLSSIYRNVLHSNFKTWFAIGARTKFAKSDRRISTRSAGAGKNKLFQSDTFLHALRRNGIAKESMKIGWYIFPPRHGFETILSRLIAKTKETRPLTFYSIRVAFTSIIRLWFLKVNGQKFYLHYPVAVYRGKCWGTFFPENRSMRLGF